MSNQTSAVSAITAWGLLALCAEIVSAYVEHNPMSAAQLPQVIRTVHETLSSLAGGTHKSAASSPFVSVKKSITHEFLVCLEDGKKLKMLKRYLRSHYDLSPDEYRAKWHLPPDYPMVAPKYAKQRSDLAKQIGLGRIATRKRRTRQV